MNNTTTSDTLMTAQSIGFAVAFLVAFILGLILGVLGCAGTIKFVEWMRGKALFFTPWPRVQSGIQNPTLQNPIVQNPTYEVEGSRMPKAQQEQPAKLQYRGEENHSSSLMTVLEKGVTPKSSKLEVYEAVDEPINEEEQALEECSAHQALPYAIHDFDKPPTDVKPSKPNRSRGSASEGKPMASGSNSSSRKPQRFVKRVMVKPPIPSQPGRSSPIHHGAMDFDPDGAYSELDKKTSYASLDPHTGLNTGVKDMNVMTESYGHLNH